MNYNQDKEEFIKYLQFQKHYSINTVESYQRSLNEFIDFLKSESISHFNDVKYTNIRGYLVGNSVRLLCCQRIQLIIESVV